MDRIWENISDQVMHWAETSPKKAAVYEGHETVTWRELALHVRSAAVELRQRGIKEDDAVGLALGNSIELLILFLATLRIGAIPVIMSTRTEPNGYAQIGQKLKFAILFVEATPDLRLATTTVNLIPGWRPKAVPAKADARSSRTADQNNTAILSSGGTGEPRAHLSTQRQRMTRAQGRLTTHPGHWSADRPGVLVVTAPLSAAMHQNSLLTQISIGGPVAVGPVPTGAADLARTLAAWDGAIIILNPNQCRGLLRCASADQLLLPRAQLMRTGGEMFSVEDKLAMIARVTPNFCEVYGAASAGTMAVLLPEEVGSKAETVGRPRPGVELQIVDPQGNPLPPNAVGAIRVRGKATGTGFLSLLDNNDAAPEGYRDGWVYPGDLGTLDNDGYLLLKGRASDRIAQDGVEFYAAEVEAELRTLAGVSDAAVVTRPIAGGTGEEAVAFLVKIPDLSHDAVRTHCTTRLPPAKMPRYIYYVDKLPKTAAGKIDRPAMRRFAAEQIKVNAAAAAPPKAN